MKTMTAVKKVAAVATMWWIVSSGSAYVSGPSGQPVKMWIGPWDSEPICQQTLGDLRNRPDASSAWFTASCQYTQTY